MIDLTNPAEVRREAERRQQLRAQGARTFDDRVTNSPENDDSNDHRIIDPIEYSLDEKAIEHECDKLAQKAGGRVIRFSHPGKTQQTPGIADRLYCFPARRLAVWWEVKAPHGAQRPGQVLFEELVTASGHEYACGGIGDLRAWLIARGFGTAEAL